MAMASFFKNTCFLPALLLLLCRSSSSSSAAACTQGCSSTAFYITASGDLLYDIAPRFGSDSWTSIQALNNISSVTNIPVGQILKIPFACECSRGALGHNFTYAVQQNDDLRVISGTRYGNLTTPALVQSANPSVNFSNNLTVNLALKIPINCSCGDPSVSKKYGLFGTYSAQPGDTLSSISSLFNISKDLIQGYNPSVSFNPLQTYSILFIPSNDSTGQYPPYSISSADSSTGNNSKTKIIVGVGIGAACLILLIPAVGFFYYRRNAQFSRKTYAVYKEDKNGLITKSSESTQNVDTFGSSLSNFGDLTEEHSRHFSYDDLVAITDNFNITKEIGKGGYATVYYGEKNGQKLAIKRMDIKDSKEFINELQILSTVHHANLVGLVGYCIESDCLFLVYEYVENGTLSEHLRCRTSPLSWERRVQIVLDAARGIEYMHDHTRPRFIHRDLKPSNILLDNNYRAKVGDFGLTRLMRPGGDSMTNTKGIKGTFGYMSPEFAQYGQVSVKQDVYAFGIILFQIVSGKQAILESNVQLASLFANIPEEIDALDKVKSIIDPNMEANYPIEAVWKVVQLAKRCTDDDMDRRPQMSHIVMELIMLIKDGHETADRCHE